jgi:hypothetical protein
MKDLIEFSHKNNLGPKGMMIVHIYLTVSSVFSSNNCLLLLPIFPIYLQCISDILYVHMQRA